jgi:hypothetical protein
VGASWGISHLETTGTVDNTVEFLNCNALNANGTVNISGSSCLIKDNQSWIGFARYNLTDWVKIQAEYIHTTAENQIGLHIHDDAAVIGNLTFFFGSL